MKKKRQDQPGNKTKEKARRRQSEAYADPKLDYDTVLLVKPKDGKPLTVLTVRARLQATTERMQRRYPGCEIKIHGTIKRKTPCQSKPR